MFYKVMFFLCCSFSLSATAKSFKVFPGDLITGSVEAYFTSTSGYTAATSQTMITALSAAMGGGVPAIDGGIATAYNTTGNPLIALGGFGGSTFPSGYLNYILFDENYVPIKAKSFPIQKLPSTRHTVQFDAPLEVKELGYLFVYLSYDNNQSAYYLYFDDLRVVVEESPLIQVNNYYPFGMLVRRSLDEGGVSATWLREGEIQNANLFQGKELISQTGCLPAVALAEAGHDFGSRMYWADLGRWFATDPQKQFSSPYVGMGNMPTIAVDPDGQFAWFIPVIAGALVGGYSGAAIQQGTWDPRQWKSDWYKGAIVGGVLGATLGAMIAPAMKGVAGITVAGEGTANTIGWSLTTTALKSGTVGAGLSEATGGEAWQGALSGLATGLVGQGAAVAGTKMFAKATGLRAGLMKLGYQGLSTTATSIAGNLASGRRWDESINLGVGPFTLAFRNGELSLNPLDNINNILSVASNVDGAIASIRGRGHFRFDESNLSWRYEDVTRDELNAAGRRIPVNKLPIRNKVSKWGCHAGTIHGTTYALNNVSTQYLFHETVHVLFTRFAGDAYLDWIFGFSRLNQSSLNGNMAQKLSGHAHVF